MTWTDLAPSAFSRIALEIVEPILQLRLDAEEETEPSKDRLDSSTRDGWLRIQSGPEAGKSFGGYLRCAPVRLVRMNVFSGMTSDFDFSRGTV